ncbi:MAG: hypothetical protein E2O91_00495 [Alphaproteobacteria bacterium]|nr:MAG: hypothetical protein E2O91_00495 [Alphaproteobacteria bacterium]
MSAYDPKRTFTSAAAIQHLVYKMFAKELKFPFDDNFFGQGGSLDNFFSELNPPKVFRMTLL